MENLSAEKHDTQVSITTSLPLNREGYSIFTVLGRGLNCVLTSKETSSLVIPVISAPSYCSSQAVGVSRSVLKVVWATEIEALFGVSPTPGSGAENVVQE